MKKVKYCIIMIILLFIPIITFRTVNAQTGDSINLFGYVTDANGNGVDGVEVKLEGTANSAITNENGFYYMNNVQPGSYSLIYDYTNVEDCDNANITIKKFDKYTDKLETAFVYEGIDNSKIENYEKQINMIAVHKSGATPSPRILKLMYAFDYDFRAVINGLVLCSSSESAFHKAGKRNWKSIGVICTNKSQEELDSGLYFSRFRNNDMYKFIIKRQSTKDCDLIDEIYKNMCDKEVEKQITDVINSNNIGKTQLDVDKDCMVNIRINAETGYDPIQFDDAYSDFIEGNVVVGNSLASEKISITLIKNTGEKARIFSQNGNYKFAKPTTSGRYRIEFKFSDKNVNGQNYEVSKDYIQIGNTSNVNQNSVNPQNTNINEIKEKFRVIDYKKEKELDNTPKECELIATTDWFDITAYSNKIYGGINLQEREKFGLEVESEVSAFKVILADGQTLAEWDKQSSNNSASNVLTNTETFIVTMDNEIRHGAILYMEYAITVKNRSNIDCEKFTIISGNDLKYNAEAKLLTDNTLTNKNIGWSEVDKDKMYILNDVETGIAKDNYIQLTDSLNKGVNKTYRVITSQILNPDCTYYNATEIVQYQNNEGRRNYNVSGNKILAGNYWKDVEREEDTGISSSVLIMPPFGEKHNKPTLIIVSIAMVLIIIVYNKLNKKHTRRKYEKEGIIENGDFCHNININCSCNNIWRKNHKQERKFIRNRNSRN